MVWEDNLSPWGRYDNRGWGSQKRSMLVLSLLSYVFSFLFSPGLQPTNCYPYTPGGSSLFISTSLSLTDTPRGMSPRWLQVESSWQWTLTVKPTPHGWCPSMSPCRNKLSQMPGKKPALLELSMEQITFCYHTIWAQKDPNLQPHKSFLQWSAHCAELRRELTQVCMLLDLTASDNPRRLNKSEWKSQSTLETAGLSIWQLPILLLLHTRG